VKALNSKFNAYRLAVTLRAFLFVLSIQTSASDARYQKSPGCYVTRVGF